MTAGFRTTTGCSAQIAERVIAGEMPHRDFDDPYTGLLGYLHGLGFLTFGVSLRSIRLVLFLFTLAWLPAMYVLARHFVPPLGAALVTALALTWTLPNYFAAVPSYYNLFLATFGMVALARHVDTDRRYWLGIAGAFGGLAFLVKSAGGFYFVAAALLFLVCRERETVSHGTDPLPASSAPSRLRDRVIDAAAARQAPWRSPHRHRPAEAVAPAGADGAAPFRATGNTCRTGDLLERDSRFARSA